MRQSAQRVNLVFEVSPLNVGGPQAWVCDIAPALKRREIQVQVISFELSAPCDCVLENRLRESGIPTERVVLTGTALQKMRLVYSKIHGLRNCDVLHSNSDLLSGLFLFWAKRCGIQVRIAHSRTPNWQLRQRGLRNWCLHQVFRWSARRYCTHAFGVTRHALESLIGSNGGRDIPCRVVPSAISSVRYSPRIKRPALAPGTSLVIGFIGRITGSKNPTFLVEVLAQIRKRGTNAELLFVGAGPDEHKVWSTADRLEMRKHVALLPPQGDVASLLSEKIDVLVLASEFEGSPRIVVEAQASGTPVVCSTAVPSDVSIVPELFHSLPLADNAGAWADSILRANGCYVPERRIKDCFARSPFEIENQADMLVTLYRSYLSQ